MSRQVQGPVLLLVAVVLLRLSLGGQYVYFVKPQMQPFLVASALVILALAGWMLWGVWKGREDVDDGHGHTGVPTVAWLMVLPVLVVFLVSPRPLGSFTAARQFTNAPMAAQPSDLPPLPGPDPVDLAISDYITRAVWGEGLTLTDRTVRLTGFVTPNPQGGWWITRLGLACCAADALSFKVRVDGAEQLPANTWVEVTGRWVPGGGAADARAIPVIEAERVERIEQPSNPYE